MTPTTPEERSARAERDIRALFGGMQSLQGPITLYQAQAYALKYNVDRRQKMLEEAQAVKLNEAMGYTLLPQMVVGAGYTQRDNNYLSTSLTPSTGTKSDSSISTDRARATGTFAVAWNVLDFGVSYLRARQAADLALVAKERRRKAAQTIMNDVRTAYWKALGEQKLGYEVDSLIGRVQGAWDRVQNDRTYKWASPAQALEYQKTLLGVVQHLQALRRDLATGRLELMSLMNLDFQRPITLAEPAGFNDKASFLSMDMPTMERTALTNRPELREADYQARVDTDETRKAILRMLPGLELSTSLNRDSNSYLVNHNWAEAGLRLTWNLMNLIAGPSTVSAYGTQEQVGEMRRLSTSMVIIAQVNVALRRFQLAAGDHDIMSRMADVEGRLYDANLGVAVNEAEFLRRAAVRIDSLYRRNLSYIELESSAGALAITLGKDPIPEDAKFDDLEGTARLLERAAAEDALVKPPVFAAAMIPAAPPSSASQPAAQATVQPIPEIAPPPPAAMSPAPITEVAPPPPVEGGLPSKLSAAVGVFANDPVVSRFVVLQQLAEAGLITPDEFASRRSANLGGLLPYSTTAPTPFAGAGRFDFSQARQALQAGDGQRAQVLDAILAANPPRLAASRPPLDRAKDRVVMLATAGLVGLDEMQREVQAIQAATQTASNTARKPKATTPYKANRPWVQ
ncbi:TolC family protein [Paramagnetospirillum kuznetsovii]|nr:TolC family protein [Paramagnetospirillum kuznetsovii]